MRRIKMFFYNNLLLIGIIFGYLLLRIIYLTKLPIFGDEAIYLEWGWKETHVPGNLFYSLYDAKQPFLLWLFGMSQQVFTDPLFAGRLVSIIFGLLSLIGLYKLGFKYLDKKYGILSAGLYAITPFFSFFDRQALMETAIGTCGVWSLYWCLQVIKHPERKKHIVILGVIIAVGLFIKSSALLFLLASMLVIIYKTIKSKLYREMFQKIGLLIITIGVFDFILLIQPQFWSTLSSNSRYSLTIIELLSFPILHVIKNMWGNLDMMFFLMTPAIFMFGSAGLSMCLRSKKMELKIISWWFIVVFFLQILFVRNTTQRYLVSFLPVYVFFVSYFLWSISQSYKKYTLLLLFITLSIPFFITIIQVVSPLYYFSQLAKITAYSEQEGYVTKATAGYGIDEVKNILLEKAKLQDLYVTSALNIGNPESAMKVYFAKNKHVQVINFESQLFEGRLSDYVCMVVDKPLYFVSRDEQQGGLNAFFMPVTHIANPYGINRIGIYTLKKPCTGKTLHIDFTNSRVYEEKI